MEQEWGLVANISGIDSVHGLVQHCCMARQMNYTPKRLLHNYLVLGKQRKRKLIEILPHATRRKNFWEVEYVHTLVIEQLSRNMMQFFCFLRRNLSLVPRETNKSCI